MKSLTLKRLATGEEGTPGVLIYDNWPFALTLEREWLDNQVGISCISAGTYYCERVDSPRFGDTFEVLEVLGRSHILFHKGNIDDDSHGCILVGEQFEPINGKKAIRASKKGYNEFMGILKDDDAFQLIITNHIY